MKSDPSSHTYIRAFLSLPLVLACALSARAVDPQNPFVGNWALTTPSGGAGWLGITADNGFYDGKLMWEVGSVEPVDSVFMTRDTMYVIRIRDAHHKLESGKDRVTRIPDAILAKADGDELSLTVIHPHRDGDGVDREEFTGKRIPTMPAAPDLSKVKFGEPISLFNGTSLEGWRLTEEKRVNGWSAENGLLVNRHKEHGGNYGNLRTDREFEDFNLTLETRLTPGGNSGVYVRGLFEVQVADTYGRPLDPHNMGAVYSRITPSESAEKPPGEWQTMDITYVDRHVTVVLNGKKIIDNKGVEGCTGGALWSDVTKPGPIYLQGDHTGIEYRNIVIRPVVK
jgi:hypothetical protein